MALCHDTLERVCLFYHKWSRTYGKTVLYWHGSKPKLVLSDPDMIKEILLKTGEWFERIDPNPSATIAQKAMFYKWEDENKGVDEFEIEVSKDLHDLTSDIISKVAFGSNYEEGKEIFDLLEHYHLVSLANRSVYHMTKTRTLKWGQIDPILFRPAFLQLRLAFLKSHRTISILSSLIKSNHLQFTVFLPTKKNRERKRLEKKTCKSVQVLIEDSHKAEQNSENLLSLLMSSLKFINNDTQKLRIVEIVDDWINQEWQSKAREEVLSFLGPNTSPTSETLNDLKLVNLILQETLRLYPNPGTLARQTIKRVHSSCTKLWGEDALGFNPMRFVEPRKHLAPYFPFGLGPNYCVGQNLALFEMKIVLAMVLQRYSFVVSPTYAHGPMLLMTVTPQYGMQIIFRRL
ncbi:hypothetical protein AAZV13_14G071400 [Glycine max]|uniref:Cytochrome P450 n=2 Tax=Glycine subgen. Soja TaxID=1462606 RepID=I1M8E6_SOYBN|nr:hypothetical protein GYH30_039322 [Glycine max]RZB67939.1 Cytochrome P450 734A6 [Glycine soja]